MKASDEHNLDRQFREGLTGPNGDVEFREEDWAAMEDLLDKKRRKKPVPVWLYWFCGSVAAVFLLFFGWKLLNPVIPPVNKIGKTPVKKVVPVIENKAEGRNKIERNNQETIAANHQHKIVTDGSFGDEAKKTRHKNSITQKSTSNASDKILVENKSTGNKPNVADNNTDASFSNQKSAAEKRAELAATSVTIINTKQNLLSNQAVKFDTSFMDRNLAKAKVASAKEKKTTKTIVKRAPTFSLAILTAPDVNGVGSFTGSKVGTNAGLQLSVQFAKKWSVTTSAVYAAKPYSISIEQYQTAATFKGKQGMVAADCKVLDIPININYQVYSKNKNAFAAGAGLSSYFMLKENYNLHFTDNTSIDLNVTNQNKHILSILNLNTTYQRKVSSNLNLLVQPYLKLPLTSIGLERVKLQSAGVAIGIGWNFSSIKTK
ncbi:outer membrane beta-barrel protein [uncultured Mucilaginibacter sp.]|uniref:outer membrane beta-barrel protein n=1 Tax=uncultured Mucilaginibacter sp. TaxID=797541 RepID=UPI00263409D1|nr:outer membrane beta-barrel protein [uncultured Mucilaginibacter sp.]